MAATAPERAGTTTVDLPIEGMTCGACAARIERGLGRLGGVASASVNLAAERATVAYDPALTGPPAFAAKVADLGYAVGRDPVTGDPAADTRDQLLAAAVLVVLILLGRWLERRARSRSGQALRRLLELGADEAMVLRDGTETPLPVAALAVGDRFVVRSGEKLATDGVVEQGRSSVDRSLLTGASGPGRGRPGRRGHRGHRQPGGPAGGAGDSGRGRHRPGPDRSAGRGRPGLQGPGAAPGRPGGPGCSFRWCWPWPPSPWPAGCSPATRPPRPSAPPWPC